VISSDVRIDEVLELSNALDIDFGTALKIYRAGYHTSKMVKALSVEKISDITGLTQTASERVAMKIGIMGTTPSEPKEQPQDEKLEIEAEVVESNERPKGQDDLKSFKMHPITGEPVELEEGGKIKYDQYYRIKPEIKGVWVTTNAGLFIILIIACIFPVGLLFPPLLIGSLVILIVLIGVSFFAANLMYKNYYFGFTKDLVIVKLGVFYKMEVHIPYGRIQNINTYQGPVDRMFGVWHLAVSATGAISVIHGVPDHEMVKAFILENVEAVKAKRAPKVDSSQGYREVYVILKDIAKNIESYRSRALLAHK
jgi:membrane protein YdbS with pleckstrin-like domain